MDDTLEFVVVVGDTTSRQLLVSKLLKHVSFFWKYFKPWPFINGLEKENEKLCSLVLVAIRN